jgi:hypothetical protein
MRTLSLFLLTAVLVTFGVRASFAQEPAPDREILTKLLQQFLAGAGGNDPAVHEKFWADDLIYTSSAGRRIGKADILNDVRAEAPAKPGGPVTTYSGEEVRIQQYGDTAVVAFRLVGTTEENGTKKVQHYLNTGTFVRRNGQWQAVAWQATKQADAPEKKS